MANLGKLNGKSTKMLMYFMYVKIMNTYESSNLVQSSVAFYEQRHPFVESVE